MTIALYLVAFALFLVTYCAFVLPVLSITRQQADDEAELAAEIRLAMLVNWSIALLFFIYFLFTKDKAAIIPVAAGALTGFYMESRQGHDGAP